MTNAIEDVLQAYGQAWAETDTSKCQTLLETCWAEDGVYCDPTGEAVGRTALLHHIGGFHQQMPDHSMTLTSGVNAHHNHIYFSWRLADPDGNVVVDGVDFGTLDNDGKIKQIIGFFGDPPAL